jgi:hypothetical protein
MKQRISEVFIILVSLVVTSTEHLHEHAAQINDWLARLLAAS